SFAQGYSLVPRGVDLLPQPDLSREDIAASCAMLGTWWKSRIVAMRLPLVMISMKYSGCISPRSFEHRQDLPPVDPRRLHVPVSGSGVVGETGVASDTDPRGGFRP